MQQWINSKTTWVQEQVCLKRKEMRFALLLIIWNTFSRYNQKSYIMDFSSWRKSKSMLYTLDEHMSYRMFWKEGGDRTQRVRPLFFFTPKKSCFRRLALADVLRREERDKPESFDLFLSTRHPPPYMGSNVWSSACPKHPPQRLPNMFRPEFWYNFLFHLDNSTVRQF